MARPRSVHLDVEVTDGIVFLNTDTMSSHHEGAPAIGICGSRSLFTSSVCVLDVLRENVKMGHMKARCTLSLAPHVHSPMKYSPPFMDGQLTMYLAAQQCVANNGYPGEKVVAHGINCPNLLGMRSGDTWTGLVLFVDMSAYQEAYFEEHLDTLRRLAGRDGMTVDKLWTERGIMDGRTERSAAHPMSLPFYVRGAVRMSITVQIPEWLNMHSPRPLVQHVLSMRTESGARRADVVETHMRQYIRRATEPYMAKGSVSEWAVRFSPLVPPWKHFVVPQYMSAQGLVTPAAVMAMGTPFPQGHSRLESFLLGVVDEVCAQADIERHEFSRAMEMIERRYLERRRTGFTDTSPEPIPAEHIDLMTSAFDSLFSMTTASMNYATDESALLFSDANSSANRRYVQFLKRVDRKQRTIEVERITLDMFRTLMFDCEDGSMGHFRLHMLICLNKFEYQEREAQALARVLDLYMCCIAKMQCVGNPTTDDEGKLVCHILSLLVLRDHAHCMFSAGVEAMPEGLTLRSNAQWAANETAYFTKDLYEGDNVGRVMGPLERTAEHDNDLHYPLPLMLCLEPTAPVPCNQMPDEFNYPDANVARELSARHSQRLVRLGRAKRVFSTPVTRMEDSTSHGATVPLMSAYPDATVSTAQARAEPFQHPLSAFYQGYISIWAPHSQFLRSLRSAELGRNPFAPALPCFLDWLCCTPRNDYTKPRGSYIYGVPHNIMMTQTGFVRPRSHHDVVFVPTSPLSVEETKAAIVLLSAQKCPEAPGDTGAASGVSLVDVRMPNLRALAANEPRPAAPPVSPPLRATPADVHLYHEEAIAVRVREALRHHTFRSIRLHATEIARPARRRVLPVVPASIVESIQAELHKDLATHANTRQRLNELCGSALTERLSQHPSFREWLIRTLGPDLQHLVLPYGLAVLRRALAQSVLDNTPIARHVILVYDD